MVPKNGLNIQDYFQRAGFGHDAVGGSNRASRTAPAVEEGFTAALARARGLSSAEGSSGQRFADYLRSPVKAHLPRLEPPSSEERTARQQAERPVGRGRFETGPAAGQDTLLAAQERSAATVQTPPVAAAASIAGNADEQVTAGMSVADRIERGIARAAAQYRLPAELIRSVIRAESNFDVRAVSTAGARGLMQLMPATARELGVKDAFDIDQNIDGGSRYLRQMLDRFDGNLRLALSAYNAGPGTVARFNGNVPYRETREYVQRVLRFQQQYKSA
ncbi:lytic transglycosylase domain-containing protein [Desulfatitalea alkaliphila]|uniref:Lytic transglycosylase domain-containing protein n=1 Tax=Desulfatitalea alkaliphila TaxID=2929485 RepID=A0AA41R7Y5_9BACT|nr:lytic transglycosylase domain-containing protein [Desulfatitalea alkaliphila]